MSAPHPLQQPLVAVVVPVYNGAAYIAECIESVLRQTYERWTLTVSDNVSTDDTVRIAAEYAAKDPRIRVVTHEAFLPQIDNWNRALKEVGPDAAYVKVLHADDWMFPGCLAEMVAVAVEHPSVGIVSAFRLEETRPSLSGIPYGQTVTQGREVCRGALEHKFFVFGSPSNILMRGDLVRKFDPFYDPGFTHADYEVCFRLLQESDLGFVFQVLTFTRRHNESYTSRHLVMDTQRIDHLLVFRKYGPSCFNAAELDAGLKERVRRHYRLLAQRALEGRSREYWSFQKAALARAGISLSYTRLAGAVLLMVLEIQEAAKALKRRFMGRGRPAPPPNRI